MAWTRRPGLGLFLALSACSTASAQPSGQAQLEGLLSKARAGTSLKLPPGDYGIIVVQDRSFERPVIVDATGARFLGLTFKRVRNVTIRGGEVTGTLDRNAIRVQESQEISLEGMTLRNARKGIIVDLSTDVVLRNNRLEALRSDGINVARSQRVLIEGNQCRNFQPIGAVFDAEGRKVKDGDHPDCIQLWSRPTAPPVSDVIIRRNVAEGTMQGIFLGNALRNGLDDGGFDRIRIEDNDIEISFPQGIGLYDARNSIVRNNRVRTVAGARLPNGRAVKGNVNVIRGSGNLVCGNEVAAVPQHPASRRCPA